MSEYIRRAGGGYVGLEAAIEKLHCELPGWWWSLGNCHVSADATIGPTTEAPDAHLLQLRVFDDGIDGTLLHPATVADALLNAIEIAKHAKALMLNPSKQEIEA